MPAGELPLHKVFVKSQLDLMTANAWMAGEGMIQQDVASGAFCSSYSLVLIAFQG
jgi:hypothetical protein